MTKLHNDHIRDVSSGQRPQTLLVTKRMKFPIRAVCGRIRTLDYWAEISNEIESQYVRLVELTALGVEDVSATIDALLEQATVHLDDGAVARLQTYAATKVRAARDEANADELVAQARMALEGRAL